MFDLLFIERLARWLTNAQVRIKAEVAANNLQARRLAGALAVHDAHLDAAEHPAPDAMVCALPSPSLPSLPFPFPFRVPHSTRAAPRHATPLHCAVCCHVRLQVLTPEELFAELCALMDLTRRRAQYLNCVRRAQSPASSTALSSVGPGPSPAATSTPSQPPLVPQLPSTPTAISLPAIAPHALLTVTPGAAAAASSSSSAAAQNVAAGSGACNI